MVLLPWIWLCFVGVGSWILDKELRCESYLLLFGIAVGVGLLFGFVIDTTTNQFLCFHLVIYFFLCEKESGHFMLWSCNLFHLTAIHLFLEDPRCFFMCGLGHPLSRFELLKFMLRDVLLNNKMSKSYPG